MICVQQKYFAEEMSALQGQRSKPAYVKKSSPLSKLDPILQDGLRVGGRLRYAVTPERSKHHAILPKRIHVTNIIIQYYHDILAENTC